MIRGSNKVNFTMASVGPQMTKEFKEYYESVKAQQERIKLRGPRINERNFQGSNAGN